MLALMKCYITLVRCYDNTNRCHPTLVNWVLSLHLKEVTCTKIKFFCKIRIYDLHCTQLLYLTYTMLPWLFKHLAIPMILQNLLTKSMTKVINQCYNYLLDLICLNHLGLQLNIIQSLKYMWISPVSKCCNKFTSGICSSVANIWPVTIIQILHNYYVCRCIHL